MFDDLKELLSIFNSQSVKYKLDICEMFDVGQVGNLRPIGNRPAARNASPFGPITNQPQITNLPHTKMSNV
jgi:hypothetical protein